MSNTDFEPRILAFLCNWCSYAGADLAGISRFQYPTNVMNIRTMCSGRVDPVFIITAFLAGLDGILVLGCHFGDCHYRTGNYYAEKKLKMTKRLLDVAGIHPERLRLDWVSAAEGQRFADIVTSFINEVKSIGPLKANGTDESLRQRLQAVRATLQTEKVRWLVGNEIGLVEKGNVFGEKISPDRFESLLDTTVHDEYIKNWIAILLQQQAMSVGEIAQATGLDPKLISSYLVDLEQTGEVHLHTLEHRTPKYIKK